MGEVKIEREDAWEEGFEAGERRGREIGKREGLEMGERRGIQTRNMEIAEYTGLSIEEVKEIKEKSGSQANHGDQVHPGRQITGSIAP